MTKLLKEVTNGLLEHPVMLTLTGRALSRRAYDLGYSYGLQQRKGIPKRPQKGARKQITVN